jgi:hypothetical protein
MSKNADQSDYPTSALNDHGLTKRELFAQTAMAAIISTPNSHWKREGSKKVARLAVIFADALLYQLEKTKK